MGILAALSVSLRLAACLWSVVLWRRLRDWRVAFLTGLLVMMLVTEVADLLSHPPSVIHQLANLGVSLLAFLAVVFIERAITDEHRAQRQLERERAHLEHLFESTPEGVVLADNESRVIRINREFTRIFGYTEAEAYGQLLDDLLAPEGLRGEATGATKTVADGGRVSFETVRRRKDGELVQVSVLGTPVHVAGGQIAVYGIYRDIGERKRAEEALRQSEQRYALAARGANDGLWDWYLAKGEIYYSPRWRSMLGLAEQDPRPDPDEWFRRVHPADRERLQSDIKVHLDGEVAHLESEHRILHKDGTYRWVLCRGVVERDAEGRAVRMAGSLTDISSRKAAEERLIHDAFHDVLTGLPNRALFMNLLEHAINRLRRDTKHRFAVLFMDVDRFKVVNDSLGHMLGDQLLIAMARRVQQCVRPGDTVARLGGDEFTVLLEDIVDVNDTLRIAERIQSEVTLPFTLGTHEVYTTVSLGIALSGEQYRKPEEVLRDADTAMYQAKAQGKARHEVFDPGMRHHAVTLLQLETDLRRALDRGEFQVFYQPIVSVPQRRLAGFEALLRWNHPERGLVVPADFIRLAEETGLIVSIGQWVLWEACRQVRTWHDLQTGDGERLTVSVNLSARQFQDPALVERVADALSVTDLPPSSLRLEITESVLMDQAEQSVRLLDQLKELGVQVQADDFGTGYSSLSYLHRFRIDALKIDRSFVAPIGRASEGGEIVRTIVTLAQNLGMSVIAEGVETDKQRLHLGKLGCQQMQGHLFSPAVEADRAVEMVKGDRLL